MFFDKFDPGYLKNLTEKIKNLPPEFSEKLWKLLDEYFGFGIPLKGIDNGIKEAAHVVEILFPLFMKEPDSAARHGMMAEIFGQLSSIDRALHDFHSAKTRVEEISLEIISTIEAGDPGENKRNLQ